MSKTKLQVLIIVMAKAVGNSDYILPSVLFFVVLTIFLVINVRIRTFNYTT
jgi:hypothetical protein